MKKIAVHLVAFTLLIGAALPLPHTFAADPLTDAKQATVFVAKFNSEGKFIGWGSGFYVDEGIVVTNKHVIEGGKYFKVFPMGADETINLDCGKELQLSDVKVNLDDDAAYIRAYVNCPHTVVQFTDTDPVVGDPVSVLGYPQRATFDESLKLSTTTGTVTGTSPDGWLTTDAYLYFGNSGGPVIVDGKVAGVAVARSSDTNGNYITGYFVPTSIVLKGLLYANNSTFGYTPQAQQASSSVALPYGKAGDPFNPPRTTSDANNGDCRQSLGEGGEATGFGGCRCKGSYHANSDNNACLPGQASLATPLLLDIPQSSSSSSQASSPRSSSSSSSPRLPLKTPFQMRTCARVTKWYSADAKILERLNARLQKRFGFTCNV